MIKSQMSCCLRHTCSTDRAQQYPGVHQCGNMYKVMKPGKSVRTDISQLNKKAEANYMIKTSYSMFLLWFFL